MSILDLFQYMRIQDSKTRVLYLRSEIQDSRLKIQDLRFSCNSNISVNNRRIQPKNLCKVPVSWKVANK